MGRRRRKSISKLTFNGKFKTPNSPRTADQTQANSKTTKNTEKQRKMRNLILIRAVNWRAGIRRLSTLPEPAEDVRAKSNQGRMTGWQIHSYSDSIEDLQLAQNLKKPLIRKLSQLLVKVLASSVNPIDVAMMSKKPDSSRFSRTHRFFASRRLRIDAAEHNALRIERHRVSAGAWTRFRRHSGAQGSRH